MGVGYDKIDRKAAAERKVLVCNVPDYGTTEVADHAMALALSLRRGMLLHHEAQRRDPPAPWGSVRDPLMRRSGVQTFGIVGLGRIGTAAALRAKAFGFRVMFLRSVPAERRRTGRSASTARATLEELLEQTDTLSVHAPLTPETRGHAGRGGAGALPKGGVVVNTARGPIIDIDALAAAAEERASRRRRARRRPGGAAGRADPRTAARLSRARAVGEGRLIITPHAAFFTPQAWEDTRVKAAETMRAALLGPRPQNVIAPDAW